MSYSRFPPEIVDYIVDLLHYERETLKECCLVSKSWVPRARKHLFSEVAFYSCAGLAAWKEAFPDPVNSPAHLTRYLIIGCVKIFPDAVVEGVCWLRAFSNVVRLRVWEDFEPWPASRFLSLVCSLPLLEDLDLVGCGIGDSDFDSTIPQSSTSPPLTGTLALYLIRAMEPTARRLLDLPNGIHFQKLRCYWNSEEDLRGIGAVVGACPETLESINIEYRRLKPVSQWAGSVDFSKAVRLKEVVFRLEELDDVWTALALKTLTPEHRDLSQISIHIPANYTPGFTQMSWETHGWWADLDHVLVRLWELNAIRARVICVMEGGREETCKYVGRLLPEMTKRGIVEVVDDRDLP